VKGVSGMPAAVIRRIVPARFRPIGYLTRLVQRRTERRVLRGPFAGMKYIDESIGSAYIPKLLGLYEMELSHCVAAINQLNPDQIIDIGAGEGYYAVGLACLNPAVRMLAFEMQPTGRRAIADLARLNQVEKQIDVRGECRVADLQAALSTIGRSVVVCDVEGAELELIDQTAVPALRNATILLELHEFVVPGITVEIKKRFSETHDIEHIWQQPRSRSDFPWRTFGTSILPKAYLDWAVSEWRPERMAWLWMQPKS
jgi:Met-10+ like-protein